jgi:hypothetical protein
MEKNKMSPVFITGMQRSGTTLLRLALNRLDNLYIPFESDFLAVAAKHAIKECTLNPQQVVEDLLEDKLSKKANFLRPSNKTINNSRTIADVISAFYAYNASLVNKSRWGIKTPGYLTKIHEIVGLFPDCKIVAILRDPRDIFLSQKGISWGARDPIKFAYLWNLNSKCLKLVSCILPKQILIVKYEELVSDFKSTLEKICIFIKEPICEDLFDFNKAHLDMPFESIQWHKNSIRKPDKNKIGRWKTELDKYESHVLSEICKEDLHLFGYSTDYIRLNVYEKVVGKARLLKG